MTEAMFYVLLALKKPGYGYKTMQRIHELSGGRLSMGPGTLYGVLTRMKKEGLIELESEDDRRKNYVLTEAGLTALNAEYARLKRMVLDGERVLEGEE